MAWNAGRPRRGETCVGEVNQGDVTGALSVQGRLDKGPTGRKRRKGSGCELS